MKSKDKIYIIIVGAPGTGKGTQALQIVKQFGFVHLSTGEIFRKKYAEADRKGKASIDKGGFFSDEMAYQLITDFLNEHTKAEGVIFDGFPRDMKQAEYFLKNIVSNPLVIELKADEDKLIKRLLQRGKKTHRADDSSDAIIHRRMKLYEELTLPVVRFFKEKGLVHTFYSEGEIENVAAQISRLITECIN